VSKASEPATNAEPEAVREMVITRVIDAPRERVWQAWTDEKQRAKWWGPNGFSTTTHEYSLKPGGVWRHTMRGPDGAEYPNESVFDEIVPPERLVYLHGGRQRDSEKAAVSFRTTVTFKAVGNKTEVTLRSIFPSKAERDRVVKEFGALEGGKQHLGKLAAHLELGDSQGGDWVFTRVLAVPRAKVFAMWTDAKRLAKWWGPNGFTNPRCEIDARPGGKVAIDMRAPDGKTEPMTGTVKEVVANERFVFTASVPDSDGKPIELLHLVTFVENGGKTILTVRSRVVRVEPAALKLLNGMNEGWTQSLDRLEASVAMG
jgi:uncharacterized protein YndB with AHSA1/START domain